MQAKGGPPPLVTGISPNEGYPGIKLTIRGENFGKVAADLTHLFINQIDVGPTAEWFSPSRVTAITPLGDGELEIVLVTNGDKFGSSSVTYNQIAKRNVGPQTSVTYWPLDERRHCPAVYQHAHETGRQGASGTTESTFGDRELDPTTGLPLSERTRIRIPISDADLREIYPVSGSLQLTDKDFDPMMFLLKFYKNCNFNDLTVTYNNFRTSLRSEESTEPLNVIRTNLPLIFRCMDGMEALRIRLLSEKRPESVGQYELPFEAALSESRNLGHQLFEGILKRRDRAESTRNAIGVMQRYQFLFNLPHALRVNISKGEYNLVLNDYLRANSLFANSDVSVLSRVYGDVENVISNFRTLLLNQLTTMPIECDEAKRKIGYLIHLQVDFDPTYDCLVRFRDWLVEQAHLFQQIYRRAVGARSNPVDSSIKTVGQQNMDFQSLNFAAGASNPGTVNWMDDVIRGDLLPMIGLVKSICDLLLQHVVQFWRLGTAFVSGQVHGVGRVEQQPSSQSKKNQRGSKVLSNDPGTLWTQLNLDLVNVLANTMREEVLEAVGGGPKGTVVADWLPHCIQEFRRCCTSLPLNEMPPEIGEIFGGLAHDLRRHVVRGIFQFAQSSIEALHLKETWDTDLNDNCGARTKLPEMYKDIISDALKRCQDQVQPRTPIEIPLFESAELQERFPDWCGDAMVAFIFTLRRLADQIENTLSQEQVNEVENRTTRSTDSGQKYVITQARGLLLLLNNAQWVQGSINGNLLVAYKTAGYAAPDRLQARLTSAWDKAIADVVSRYVRLRGPWLCAPIRLLASEIPLNITGDSDRKFRPTGVHTRVRTALGNISHVYSELVLILGMDNLSTTNEKDRKRPCTIQSILTRVITMLVNQLYEFSNTINIQSLPRTIQLHLRLDCQTIRAVLPKGLFTPEAGQQLDTICAFSTSSADLDSDLTRYLDDLVEKEKVRVRCLIEGLRSLETVNSVIVIRA